jgi:hypothetical protein
MIIVKFRFVSKNLIYLFPNDPGVVLGYPGREIFHAPGWGKNRRGA